MDSNRFDKMRALAGLTEGVAMKAGTVRSWDGVDMIKQPDGSWIELDSYLGHQPARSAAPGTTQHAADYEKGGSSYAAKLAAVAKTPEAAAKIKASAKPQVVPSPAPETEPSNQPADKHSKNGWSRVGVMKSASNPNQEYVIGVRTLKDGSTQVGCDCPGWKYAKNQAGSNSKKPCKHLQALMAGQGSKFGFVATPYGSGWLHQQKIKGECVVDLSMEALCESISEESLNWYDLASLVAA